MDLVLALDQGSSSSRVLAIDSKGRISARAQFPVKTSYPRPGWVEHDAGDLARSAERALDAVLSRLPKKANILGLGMACQRSTVALWDAKTGAPAAPAPSWQDARGASVAAALGERGRAVHDKTGLYLTPFYSAPKVRFLIDNEKHARGLLEQGRLRVGPVSSYLLWRLTGGEIFRTDPTMAQRMLLFNIRRGEWDEDLMSWFGIGKEILPELSASACSWGVIERKGRSFPVLAVLGDQQAAAYGQGAEDGVGVLNYGTGAFFLLNTGSHLRHVPGLLSSVAWQREGTPCEYFLEGTVHAAGTSLEWLKQNFGLLKDVRAADALCRKSTHRIWALQAIGGLGAPRWDYQTPTAYLGLTARSRPEDLVRAVTESIAFLISDIVCAIRESGVSISALRASGGLARMDYLLQFQADLLSQPIARLAEKEATALGVARLAAEQAGAPWAKALAGGGVAKEFKPAIKPEESKKLLSAWRAFVDVQRRLSRVMRQMGAI